MQSIFVMHMKVLHKNLFKKGKIKWTRKTSNPIKIVI
jgi:hypothetical protein